MRCRGPSSVHGGDRDRLLTFLAHRLQRRSSEPTTHTVGLHALEAADADYYWRVRAHQRVRLRRLVSRDVLVHHRATASRSVLLVDDDYDVPNEQPEFTPTRAGQPRECTYDVWDVWNGPHRSGNPTRQTLALYDQIIWYYSRRKRSTPDPNDRPPN